MKPGIAIALVWSGVAAAQDIRVEGGGGTLAPGAADQAIQSAGPQFQACYKDHAIRYVGGRVSLAVRVGTNGKKRAEVDGSDLGSWEVERCLLDVARNLGLGAAKGGDVTVSVPLEFQAGAEAAPMGEGPLKEAAAKLRPLLRCGPAKGTDVTFYVGPGGQILSVGFGRPPSERWAECATQKAKQVTLTDPRGQVMKATVQP